MPSARNDAAMSDDGNAMPYRNDDDPDTDLIPLSAMEIDRLLEKMHRPFQRRTGNHGRRSRSSRRKRYAGRIRRHQF